MTGGGPLDFERDERDEGDEREAAPPPAAPPPAAPPPPPPARPPGRSRFTWVIGIAVLLVAVSIMLNAIGGATEDTRPGGPRPGERLAPFAAPDADSQLYGDANIATEDTVSDEAGRRPACEVRQADVVNICELSERGPVVLAMFPADAKRCRAVLRQFDRVRGEFAGRVSFAAVGSGKNAAVDDREAQQAERKPLLGHDFPVAYDRDQLVSGLYGLAGCPQIVFARRGGVVRETTYRELTDAQLRARVEALLR